MVNTNLLTGIGYEVIGSVKYTLVTPKQMSALVNNGDSFFGGPYKVKESKKKTETPKPTPDGLDDRVTQEEAYSD